MSAQEANRSVIERAAALQMSEVLEDPDQLRALIVQLGDQATVSELKVLWETAVAQKALASVLIANGDGTAITEERFAGWAAGESVLRTALASSVSAGTLEMELEQYWLAYVARQAMDVLIPHMRRLEALLERQHAILGFHYADEQGNDFRANERRLSAILVAQTTSPAARLEAATAILAAADRYRTLLFNKLTPLMSEIVQANKRCSSLVALCEASLFSELNRWSELTNALVGARTYGMKHLSTSLELDTVIPNDVVEGKGTTTEKGEDALGPEATQRMKTLAMSMAETLAQSIHVEQSIRDERTELVNQLLASQRPGTLERSDAVTISSVRSHPIEARMWFRSLKVAWYGAFAFGVLLSWIAAETTQQLLILAGVVGVLMFGVRTLVLYILLGRTTMFEKADSDFVDLDVIEEIMIQKGEFDPSTFGHLRVRYGRRAPKHAVSAFIEGQLKEARSKKRDILSDADRRGASVSIESLRNSVLRSASDMSQEERETQLTLLEVWLLRMEVRYGAEIPVSAADAEVDLLSSEAQR
jgi:hypothetical protein